MTSPCPACGEPIGPDDGFCEVCGAELAPAAVSSGAAGGALECPVCAADGRAPAGVSPEGYCEFCGRKVPSGRDREELDVGLAAGVTDRGLRHARNEDAMALAATRVSGEPVALAVVCDGVSSAPRPDEASLSAVRAAAGSLLSAVRAGDDPAAASAAAARAAGRAVGDLAGPAGAPAATYASAVVDGTGVTVCWLGDSRVYWLAADVSGSRCLTTDDSLAEELVAAGLPPSMRRWRHRRRTSSPGGLARTCQNPSRTWHGSSHRIKAWSCSALTGCGITSQRRRNWRPWRCPPR